MNKNQGRVMYGVCVNHAKTEFTPVIRLTVVNRKGDQRQIEFLADVYTESQETALALVEAIFKIRSNPGDNVLRFPEGADTEAVEKAIDDHAAINDPSIN